MDDTTILGGALNQLGQTVKQTAKQIVKLPEEMAADAGGQVGVAVKQPVASAEASSFAKATEDNAGGSKQKSDWKSDEERIKFLKDLYGKSDPSVNSGQAKKDDLQSSQTSQSKKLSEFQEQIKDKSPEEQKALMELRSQLHKENYYDPTFNPVKNPPAGGEERPAEKVENEKKQEMQDLQQKDAKKPPPLAVVREQNKAEMFRGAAG